MKILSEGFQRTLPFLSLLLASRFAVAANRQGLERFMVVRNSSLLWRGGSQSSGTREVYFMVERNSSLLWRVSSRLWPEQIKLWFSNHGRLDMYRFSNMILLAIACLMINAFVSSKGELALKKIHSPVIAAVSVSPGDYPGSETSKWKGMAVCL